MKHLRTREELEHIWHEVPPDYYQKGIKKNLLQRMWHTNKVRIISEAIKASSPDPSNILDVGCASGWLLAQLKKLFPQTSCTGIDVYKDAIRLGRKKYKNLRLLPADAHKLPFKDGLYDVVVCNEVLEHVVNPLIVLREIKRVLKKNGTAIVEMDTGNILFRIVWFFWTHVRKGVWQHAHIQVFNSKRLEKMIQKTGFRIEKKKIFNSSMAVVFICKKQ